MDVRFLKDISEAYILDTELKISSEEIFNEVYGLVKFLRSYDLELYNELYENTKLTQQRIIKGYLDQIYIETSDNNLLDIDDLYQNIISEEVTLTLALPYIVLAIIGAVSAGPITKAMMKAASVIGGWFEKFGNFLKTRGKYMQLRYSIVQENTRRCYVKCGIDDPKKLSALTYFSLVHRSTLGSKESFKQGTCLRDCYIDNLIELIALHMESYFACLKKTGGFDAFNKVESDDLMRMISSTNLGSSCELFYDEAKEALDNFYKTLDLVYDKNLDSDLRLAVVNKLRSRIYQARQTIQRTDVRQLERYTKSNNTFEKNK